ncbi:unnamed protein product, partial [Ectocarpus sp. 12 AP-2014]
MPSSPCCARTHVYKPGYITRARVTNCVWLRYSSGLCLHLGEQTGGKMVKTSSWSEIAAGMGQRLALSLVCGVVVLQAVAAADGFNGSSYARNVSLDTSVDIFWTVDLEAETIRVAVHAKAATGWAGVGISEMGGMEGADIVFYETATGDLTDAHSLVAGTPVVDECTQDWTLLSAEVGDGSLV